MDCKLDRMENVCSQLEYLNLNTEQNDLLDLLSKLDNAHYPVGPIYQIIQKIKALVHMECNEVQAIYHLAESHAPGLRYKAIGRYEKSITEVENRELPLNREHLQFPCRNKCISDDVNTMLKQVEDMPKEWTIVQLTPQYYKMENMEVGLSRNYTTPIHITVFNCGKDQPKPFCITADVPFDKISGKVVEIRNEMASIIHDNKAVLSSVKPTKKFNEVEKRYYCESRISLNSRLQNLVKDIQDMWLKEWRCLLIGKYMDDGEKFVDESLNTLLKELKCFQITEKTKCILKCLIKASAQLKPIEVKNAVQHCFPGKKEIYAKLVKMIKDFSNKMDLPNVRRHPVILAVDEKLDELPWEMLDVLQDHPVSRMPSLRFTYALYKEHEHSIVNGCKTAVDSRKGQYIINPNGDLKRMELRMHSFFKYWRPDWNGLAGTTPTCTDFEGMLVDSDIFSYDGHGNGTQFLSASKIQRLKVNAVVFLFGCGSIKYYNMGPRVEMFGSHQMYLIACSPCIVGMLWEVTDLDTDILSTEFWSKWLPTEAPVHWKHVDKKTWDLSGEIIPSSNNIKNPTEKNEPELLRALSTSRKAGRQYLTQAACVARGIPVKID